MEGTTNVTIVDVLIFLLSASFGGWAILVKNSADKLVSELKTMREDLKTLATDLQEIAIATERRLTMLEARMQQHEVNVSNNGSK